VYVYLDASADDVHVVAPRDHLVQHELVAELRERIRYLERQVEEERAARYRADELLARLMHRMPELQAPPEARGSPETASAGEGEEVPPEAQEGSQRRSCWQFWKWPR
jgi:hypothetical protein